MKLEENTLKPINSLQKQPLCHSSDFKQKVPQYINEINLSTFLLDQNQSAFEPVKVTKEVHLQTQKNILRSEKSTTLETSAKFYLFLGRSMMMENYSEIILYQYMKVDGQFKSLEMNGIKGEISCLQTKYTAKRRQNFNKKSENLNNTKKSSSSKNTKESVYEIVLLIGTAQGYLKALRFQDIEQNQEPRFTIDSIRLDYCQIADLIGLDSSYYNGANVCLALSVTNRVYLVNFDSMSLVAYFLPTVLGCEVGLGLSINYEEQYFIQTCEGGYIIFWGINDKIIELIAKSSQQPKIQQQSVMPQKAENNNYESMKQTFHSSDIYHCIHPLNIFHSATISGLKYCQLYGNLLILITQGGLLKLLAINKSSLTYLCQNQYTSLLEYQIGDGQLITDVKFFPENMEIFVVKSWIFDGFVNKSGLQKHMPVKQFQIDRQALKKKDKSQTKASKVYKPLRIKSFQNNVIPERPRSKSSDNRHKKCYFERIIFNSELQIEQVDKIYPSQHIDCIESLEMTDKRDIIVLRGRDYYLIGATEVFITQQIL